MTGPPSTSNDPSETDDHLHQLRILIDNLQFNFILVEEILSKIFEGEEVGGSKATLRLSANEPHELEITLEEVTQLIAGLREFLIDVENYTEPVQCHHMKHFFSLMHGSLDICETILQELKSVDEVELSHFLNILINFKQHATFELYLLKKYVDRKGVELDVRLSQRIVHLHKPRVSELSGNENDTLLRTESLTQIGNVPAETSKRKTTDAVPYDSDRKSIITDLVEFYDDPQTESCCLIDSTTSLKVQRTVESESLDTIRESVVEENTKNVLTEPETKEPIEKPAEIEEPKSEEQKQ